MASQRTGGTDKELDRFKSRTTILRQEARRLHSLGFYPVALNQTKQTIQQWAEAPPSLDSVLIALRFDNQNLGILTKHRLPNGFFSSRPGL